jgi:hypothetical protein
VISDSEVKLEFGKKHLSGAKKHLEVKYTHTYARPQLKPRLQHIWDAEMSGSLVKCRNVPEKPRSLLSQEFFLAEVMTAYPPV